MRRWIAAVALIAAVILGFASGYLCGNRQAAIICLEQWAADNRFAYKMLINRTCDSQSSNVIAVLLCSGIRSLEYEKHLLEHPLRRYADRPGAYAVITNNTEQQLQFVNARIVEWQSLLEANRTGNMAEQEPSGVPAEAAGR